MAAQGAHETAVAYVPHHEQSMHGCRDQGARIARHRQRRDAARVAMKRAQHAAVLQVPDLQGAIVCARRSDTAVAAEYDRRDAAIVRDWQPGGTREIETQARTVEVPYLDGEIGRCRDREATVVADREGRDRVAMGVDVTDDDTTLQAPDLEPAVVCCRDHVPTVRSQRHAIDCCAVAHQRAQQRATGRREVGTLRCEPTRRGRLPDRIEQGPDIGRLDREQAPRELCGELCRPSVEHVRGKAQRALDQASRIGRG